MFSLLHSQMNRKKARIKSTTSPVCYTGQLVRPTNASLQINTLLSGWHDALLITDARYASEETTARSGEYQNLLVDIFLLGNVLSLSQSNA